MLLCGGLEAAPLSAAYEVLATGCTAADPGPPQKPPYPPTAAAHSPTSVRLSWAPPPLDLAALEPPRDGFWVSWRGGGAKALGWKEQTYVTESNATVRVLKKKPARTHFCARERMLHREFVGVCARPLPRLPCLHARTHARRRRQVYDVVSTAGGARTVKAPLLQFTVTGLASATPYEFRFCAVNEHGRGAWSEPCAAAATGPLGSNAPASQALLTLDQWHLRFGQGDPSLQVRVDSVPRKKRARRERESKH